MKICRKSLLTGQSLVEFALIVPLLVAMMFILVELGIIFSVYIGLTNSAREGARAGSFYQYPYPRTSAPLSAAMNTACATQPATTPDVSLVDCERQVVMDTQITETLNTIIVNSSLTRAYSYPEPSRIANSYRYGDKVVVTLVYNHNLFFNLFGSSSITLRANSEMKLEPGGL